MPSNNPFYKFSVHLLYGYRLCLFCSLNLRAQIRTFVLDQPDYFRKKCLFWLRRKLPGSQCKNSFQTMKIWNKSWPLAFLGHLHHCLVIKTQWVYDVPGIGRYSDPFLEMTHFANHCGITFEAQIPWFYYIRTKNITTYGAEADFLDVLIKKYLSVFSFIC